MRVLLVSANYAPHVGGIERFTENLADGLGRRGHEVTVLCCRFRRAQRFERRLAHSVNRIRSLHAIDRWLNVPYPVPEPLELVRGLRRELSRADIVHVQDVLYATSLPALMLARRLGVPSVLTQHVGFVPQRSRALDAVEHAAVATLGRCARLATIVATLNPAVAEWARQQWALPDVRVLPVGVAAPTAAVFDRSAVRRSFDLPADRFLALFVGRDVPKKGLDVFIAARDPAYELVAVTDRTANGGGVVLVPFMDHDRLQALLSSIDAFVLPSEAEGFPVSVQEALAAGIPVVTTFQPGYERYLSPDDVLYVERDPVAVREALLRLVADEEFKQRLAERGRDVARRHFSVDRFVDAYEELYAEARGRPARAG